MKYLKTYESLDMPEIGDYVICKDHSFDQEENEEFSNMIGQIVDKNSFNFNELGMIFHNAQQYEYFVKFKEIPEYSDSEFYKTNDGYIRPFFRTEIKFSAKTIDELELKKEVEKYNL